MTNLFLADEINRTSSRTQSALLEAMEEEAVTVDSVTYPLPKPFFVLATENPVGSAGTQRLPESQLDRFMIRISMGYQAGILGSLDCLRWMTPSRQSCTRSQSCNIRVGEHHGSNCFSWSKRDRQES